MTSDIFGLFAPEIGEAIRPFGLESYRGKQIAEWMYRRGVRDFAAMTSLSKGQREILASHFRIGTLKAETEQHSADKKTSKFLLRLADGNAIETVLMRQPYGNSVCVSTQVGCAMGCRFCASTLHGVIRNLSAGEILGQVLYIDRLLKPSEGVSTIVIMGSGEPLANYEQVLRFIRLCHEGYCLNLSYRSITLSTAGVVPGIDRLAAEVIPINLSISLHASNNEVRSQLMPLNDIFPIEEVLAAAGRYAKATGRRVTYEYTLIKGINDRPQHARELAGKLKGQLANVNLIPVNPVAEKGFERPDTVEIIRFAEQLRRFKVNVTVRREMGADIQAACGQLRRKVIETRKNAQ
ncbi:MAG: 23S rRNA (adenine(2503)-C(2))-methyltransferase RlmN [Negativicutes bacterium]|nr:23S rRNA (adenine(2503)-C(2))-methyltransferase RlmN [Negativicutes bacterium]